MSHTPPPLTDDDLSAALDGEAGPDLLARIEADADARDRLARLRTASEAVSEPVAPLAPAIVDELVGAALASRSNRPVDDGIHGQPTVAAAPSRPRRDTPRLPTRALVAAVVVVLVAIGLGLVWSGQHQDQASEVAGEKAVDTSAGDGAGTAADRAAAGSDTGAEAGATTTSPPSHGGLATTTVAPDAAATTGTGDAGLVDLGSFDSADDLRTALADSFAATGRTSGTGTSPSAEATAVPNVSVTRCAEQLKTVLTLDGDPTHQGTAEVGGETLLVYEFATTTDDGRTTSLVAAVDTDTCSPTLLFQR